MTVAEAVEERPILFSGPMVRAILSGQKTQTRRVVKWVRAATGLPNNFRHDWNETYADRGFPNAAGEYRNGYLHVAYAHPEDADRYCVSDWPKARVYSPYGDAGDRLWVRETWAPASEFDPSPELGAIYWADRNAGMEKRNGDLKWRPSIHMPRWACRLVLEITAVRAERLQDTSHEDAIAEGVAATKWGTCPLPVREQPLSVAQLAYSYLWDEINGPDSWDSNPWVWVISFKRVTA